MRKDKGLNGDLDRLPLLTWIMFLKFPDDLEDQREQEAALAGRKFRPALEPPYRCNCNLDRKNPRAKDDIAHLPPEQLAASILEKERRIAEIIENIQTLLARHGA